MLKYFSPSHITAGLIAVIVGFTSSAAIVFQAAVNVGANNAEVSSWLLAISISTGLSCILLSLYYRMPILTAWSTPGAAMLVGSLSGLSLSQAIGAFLFSAMLTLLAGITGWFEKTMSLIPRELAAAMLAGILLHFGVNVFMTIQQHYLLAGSMLFAYLVGKRFFPRHTMLFVLAVGFFCALEQKMITPLHFNALLTHPVFTAPQFSWPALFGVGLPLFIITMTSQNIPGIAVMHAEGYRPPISPLISWTGIINLLSAPFGGFSCNLAALTAAICAGDEADSDRTKRYRATLCAGFFYLLMGLFASSVVVLFKSFPEALIMTVAGLALFSTIGSNLHLAFHSEKLRDPALITFMITVSGIHLLGISAAFWGLLAGLLTSKFIVRHSNAATPVAKTT